MREFMEGVKQNVFVGNTFEFTQEKKIRQILSISLN